MDFVKYPKIGQFRDVVYNIRENTAYAGMDEDGVALYNYEREMPVIRFEGTVKLHGTNAGITYNTRTGALVAQSRNRILTVGDDNFGFAQFVHDKSAELREMFAYISNFLPDTTITIFGEWCGAGIQNKVAISELPKMFVVFDMQINGEWVDHIETLPTEIAGLYRSTDFPVWFQTVDFNKPDVAAVQLEAVTLKVEAQCPVAFEFGVKGIGEGMVWKAKHNNRIWRFKVKGEQHSASKVKTIASIDPEKLVSIQEFVEYAVTENRLEQGIREVFESRRPAIQEVGNFIKWVSGDVFDEESDTLEKSGLTRKDVVRSVNNKTLTWFKAKFA